jgi:hypothetical protein
MKRTLYFLRDSVTGKFYNGENCDNIGRFDTAAVYWQRENAAKRIKRLVNVKYSGSWEWTEKCLQDYDNLHWGDKAQRLRDVQLRKDLPNWGIEIVSAEIEEKLLTS